MTTTHPVDEMLPPPFPYTSFSQNVGLVGVTGMRSHFVCVAGGIILIVLGLVPKMGALAVAAFSLRKGRLRFPP